MIIRRLATAVARAMIACCVHRSWSVFAFLMAFIATPLTHPRENVHYQGTKFLHKGTLHRLEVAFYRLVMVPLIAFLPAPLAYGIARLYGDFQFRRDQVKREQTMYCLKSILGDQLSPDEQWRVVRDYFRLRSCEAIDIMRMAGSGRALARQVEIRGLEHIEAALAVGKGAILCGGHFGSYDSCFSLIGCRGYPITVVGRWPSKVDRNRSTLERFFFRLFFQKQVEHHRRPNIEPRAGQLGVAVQAANVLRKNELIGALLDSPVIAADRQRAISVDFLNGQALLLNGAIAIAQLMQAPVLMICMRRSSDWRHQVLEISPPLSLDGDTLTVFKRGLSIVETSIRRDPAHWIYWELSVLVQFGLLSKSVMETGVQSSL